MKATDPGRFLKIIRERLCFIEMASSNEHAATAPENFPRSTARSEYPV